MSTRAFKFAWKSNSPVGIYQRKTFIFGTDNFLKLILSSVSLSSYDRCTSAALRESSSINYLELLPFWFTQLGQILII